tara:strand:+ start:99179 stop:100282 length:1104 start_codon:yes stop_codon:yes gene_type:complete
MLERIRILNDRVLRSSFLSRLQVILGVCIFTIILSACSQTENYLSIADQVETQKFIETLPESARPGEGFQFSYFNSVHGYNIRYGSSEIKQPLGTIILVPGQSEFSESYFELINDINDIGYSVWIMDFYGQGGSDHLLSDNARADNNFHNDVDDLSQFVNGIVKNTQESPLIILGHSMGGHIVLSAILEKKLRVDGAVLSSPMIKIKTGAIPHGITELIASIGSALGGDWWIAPGQKEWVEKLNYNPEDNVNTSDSERSLLKESWRKHTEHTRKSYAVTFGWLKGYSESRKTILSNSQATEITTPILMTVAGEDALVIPEDSLELCKRLISCESIFYNNSRHELYLEKDNLRNKWMRDIFLWINRSF